MKDGILDQWNKINNKYCWFELNLTLIFLNKVSKK